MRFEFKVTIEIERDQGKFAARDEIATLIQEALEGADYGSWSGDNGGEYSTQTWDVEEVVEEKPKRENRAKVKEPQLLDAFNEGRTPPEAINATPIGPPEWTRD